MSDYVTDPDLLAELNGSTEKKEKEPKENAGPSVPYVDDAELLKQLNAEEVRAPAVPEEVAAQTALGALTGPGYAAPTGLKQVATAIGENAGPAVQGVKSALGGYVKNPLTAAIDYGAIHMGLPPPYATMNTGKGLYNTYKGVSETLQGAGQALNASPEAAQALKPFVEELYKSNPKAAMALNSEMEKVGVKKALEGFKAPAGLSEEALASLNAGRGIYSAGARSVAGQVAGGLLRGAARVAGPVGLALNAYDAAQFAHEADLGGRLARGEGKLAPQAYRGLVNQNVSGYQVTPQEASNLLASGDERTINIYGGRQNLQNIIDGAVRGRAANRALTTGPAVPQ